jgi:hypothetical protein
LLIRKHVEQIETRNWVVWIRAGLDPWDLWAAERVQRTRSAEDLCQDKSLLRYGMRLDRDII